MKKKIRSNIRQILEIIVLAVVVVLPQFVDFHGLFKDYLEKNYLSPDNWMWYLALSYGKWIITIVLVLFVLCAIRKFNNEFVMNRSNVYHDYCYGWYWFCAKVLGIKKCNLVLVPIYMQFKLIINETFEEYPLNEEEYPVVDNEIIKVTKSNENALQNEINLILEDTYIIKDNQIPFSKRNRYTIKISRNDGNSRGRHFSQNFIETTINTVREFQSIPVMNVYATMNPLNTKHIAKRVFALGDRGNVAHLYVFQQNNNGIRKFESRGYKIY